MSAAAQLVSKCLAVRTAAHKSHLTTRSYARAKRAESMRRAWAARKAAQDE